MDLALGFTCVETVVTKEKVTWYVKRQDELQAGKT
jgi:hypothetical protein